MSSAGVPQGYELHAQCLLQAIQPLPYLSGLQEKHSYSFFFDEPIDLSRSYELSIDDVRVEDLFTPDQLDSPCDSDSSGTCYNTREIKFSNKEILDCGDWAAAPVSPPPPPAFPSSP